MRGVTREYFALVVLARFTLSAGFCVVFGRRERFAKFAHVTFGVCVVRALVDFSVTRRTQAAAVGDVGGGVRCAILER